METYLFCLAVFAVVLNVVQCVKARKDKSEIKELNLDYAGLMDTTLDLTNQEWENRPRLKALDWIVSNPCGRTTRQFLKFASTNVNGVDGAIKEFLPEIRGGA